jgi:hypothetical protein
VQRLRCPAGRNLVQLDLSSGPWAQRLVVRFAVVADRDQSRPGTLFLGSVPEEFVVEGVQWLADEQRTCCGHSVGQADRDGRHSGEQLQCVCEQPGGHPSEVPGTGNEGLRLDW